MALEFFWASGSCNSWRVHLALRYKRVAYESRLLNLGERQHKQPDYLAINPRGKVPAIRDGAYTLYESVAILHHLERRFPDPPIFGRNPEETGLIARWVSEHVCYIEPAGDAVIMPFYQGKASGGGEPLRKLAATFRVELDRLEAALAASEWLVGATPSAADFTVFPELMHLRRATEKDPATMKELGLGDLAGSHPAVHRWMQRIEALPGYEHTYPPHWR